MPLIYQHRIYRADLRRNPEVRYVFGDNVARIGLGGQAGEMRGEPNAIGIATKWRPSMRDAAFFSDDRYLECLRIMVDDLEPALAALLAGRIVVWPADGIGTGLSELPQRAPKLLAAFTCHLKEHLK